MRGGIVFVALCLLLPLPGASAGGALDEAAQMLRSDDHRDRLAALERLESGGADPGAEKLVVRALQDDDWGVQLRAAKALVAVVATPSGLQALVRLAIEGEIDAVRAAAVEGLAATDATAAVERLLVAARASRDEVRKARAIEAAGELASAEHLPRLRPFLKARDALVVVAAARAVGRLARDDAVRADALKALGPVLADGLENKGFLPYAAALEGLGEADAAVVQRTLLRQAALQEDDDLYVLERVARALAAMEQAGVAEELGAVLAPSGRPLQLRRSCWIAGRLRAVGVRPQLEALLKHANANVRAAAAHALGELADTPSALALALRLRDTDPGARAEVLGASARVLAREDFRDLAPGVRTDPSGDVRLRFVLATLDTGDAESVPGLSTFLADADWRVASAAAAAIGTLGVADDARRLRGSLAHDDWRVRGGAYEGIARLHVPEAVPYLIHGLTDRSLPVRQLCHASLLSLTGADLELDQRAWRAWWGTNGAGFSIERGSAPNGDDDASGLGDTPVLRDAALVVVQARSDHVERVLEQMEVPHDAIRAQELKTSGLTPDDVVFVNCGANMDSDAQGLLRWFVHLGGTLLTSDEALVQVVEPCFPGYLSRFARANTNNMVVAVDEARPGQRLTRGVLANVPEPHWWLEEGALALTVDSPLRCEVLVDSAVMKSRYGTSALAATFRYGMGRVVHSVSHFYLQEPGLQHVGKSRARMAFAADHLGLPIPRIRALARTGRFEGSLNDATMRRVAPDYTAFRLAVNIIRERRRWVDGR